MHEDYACFAIWEDGRRKESEIVSDIAESFEILGDFIIHWTDEKYNQNIARLYEANKYKPFKKYNGKIGKTPFRFLVVRDTGPKYAYERSVSGQIERCNVNITAKKYLYRSWFDKPYQVHSSNNKDEFMFQTPLILGVGLFEETLSGALRGQTQELHQDLAGAHGWDSWEEFFTIVNYSCDYVILRGFEGIPKQFDYNDLDLLTANFQRFASAANVKQSEKSLYKGRVIINKRILPVDMHFVGDNYYPPVWAKDILAQKRLHKNMFYVPDDESLFFSLLYHCGVHKPFFKDEHKKVLDDIAARKKFDWFPNDIYGDHKKVGELIGGYMRSRSYYYEKPVDPKVGENKDVIALLPSTKTVIMRKTLKQRIKNLPKKFRKVFSKK